AEVGSVDVMVSVNGGPYTAYPLTASGGGLYDGAIPPVNCYDRVAYYFRAQTDETTPRTFTWPLNAASGDVFRAYGQSDETVVFADNFETDQGWTVQNDGSLTSGAWTRAVPIYNGGPGAVVGDADNSGRCFVTGNNLNGDVD